MANAGEKVLVQGSTNLECAICAVQVKKRLNSRVVLQQPTDSQYQKSGDKTLITRRVVFQAMPWQSKLEAFGRVRHGRCAHTVCR